MKRTTLSLILMTAALTACGKPRSTPERAIAPVTAPTAASAPTASPAASTAVPAAPSLTGQPAPMLKDADHALLTNTKIVAHEGDMKCTDTFLKAFLPLELRVRQTQGRLEKAMTKMQSMHDDNELTGDVQGEVVKEFTTLRASMTEMAQTFGRQFACVETKRGAISGDSHFAQFNEFHARLGKLIGTHLTGDQI